MEIKSIWLLEITANFALLPEFQIQIFFMVVELLEVGFVLLQPHGNSILSAGLVYRELFLLNAKRAHQSLHPPFLVDRMSALFVVNVFGGVVV